MPKCGAKWPNFVRNFCRKGTAKIRDDAQSASDGSDLRKSPRENLVRQPQDTGNVRTRLSRIKERLLRDVMDNMVAMIGLLTPDGVLTRANRTALHAADLKPEDVLGKPFEEAYWWAWSTEVQKRLKSAMERCAAGEGSRYDEVIRVGENEFRTIDFMLAPMFGSDGRVVYLIPSATDITERKMAEEALRQSESKYRSLFENLPVGVGSGDSKGRTLSLNPAGLKLHGLVSYSVEPVRDSNGKIDLIVYLIQELTERKKAEETLQERERRFRELADSMPATGLDCESGRKSGLLQRAVKRLPRHRAKNGRQLPVEPRSASGGSWTRGSVVATGIPNGRDVPDRTSRPNCGRRLSMALESRDTGSRPQRRNREMVRRRYRYRRLEASRGEVAPAERNS